MKSCHPLFTLPTSMCRSTNTWSIKELDIENQIIVTHIPWKYWYRKYWASRPQIPYQSSTYDNNKIQWLFYDHSFTLRTTQLNQLHTPCKIQKQVDTTLNKPCILCEQRKKICAEGLYLKSQCKTSYCVCTKSETGFDHWKSWLRHSKAIQLANND